MVVINSRCFSVLFHSSRPRSTRECKLSDNTKSRRSDVDELARPSCSYLNDSLRESQSARSRRGQPRGKGRKQTNKATPTRKGGNTSGSIRKYLSKCDLSGIGQLEEPNDFSYEESTEAKVHNWLGNLTKNDEFDKSEKVEVVQPTECNLDDTLTISVSQNNEQNEGEDMEVTVGTITKNDVDRAIKQVRRNTNNERETPTDARGRRWSTETRNSTKNHSSRMNFSLENSRPSTSGATRSLDDSKERNEEKFMDVHRTSTCEVLSNMQKNWSTVTKVGKEMRTRKKKLMSLNVSVESKRKSRPMDESTEMNLNADEDVKSKTKVVEDERQRRRGTESKMARNVAETAVNEEFVSGKKSLIKGDFVRGREASPGDRNERSISEEVSLAGESFVITLQEGKVPVRSLKSCQINAIIGVTKEDPTRANIETDESSNREEMAFPADRRVDPFDTPFRDRDKIFSQMTLPLSPSEQIEPNLIDKPINKRNYCPTPTIETIDFSSSATNCQTSTPRRNRLSLNRRSAGDSSRSNVSSSISLQSVRRDLNHEIESEDHVDKRRPEGVIKTKKVHEVNEFTSKRPENSKCNMPSITFTKLGKTFRHCERRRARFLYLGSTKRAMLSRYPGFHLQKPCNPIDIVGSQDFAIESHLKDNDRDTVSDTQPMDTQPMDEEPERKEPDSIIAEGNNSSKMKDPVGVFNNQVEVVRDEDSSREVAEEIVEESVSNNSENIDILFESLNESRIPNLSCVEQPAKSSNTPTKDIARMMSPARDAILQSLLLESPTTINALQTQRIIHEPGEPSKEKSRTSSSRDFLCTSDTSNSSYVSRKRRKRSNSREKLCNRMKRKLEDDDEDNSSSDHSFSSQATCRNSDKKDAPFVKKTNLGEKSELSNPSTKDIDVVSLSSDSDVAPSEGKKEKKNCKRILSLESSDADSMNTGCASKAADKSLASDSASTKRKRAVSPDSVSSIVDSWTVDDRYRKKGKLDSMNACRRQSEDNASAKSGSSYRDKSTNKLSTTLQRRQRSDFSVDECNNRERSSSFRRTDFRRKSLEVREALVTDEDSPDFGAIIDEVKILQNKPQDFTQEDNFDDIIANVNTDTLVNECNNEMSKRESLSIECLEKSSCERKSKPGKSHVKHPCSSSERIAHLSSNGSNKENKNKTSDIVYGSDDELNEENVVKMYVNKSSRNDKLPEETKSNDWFSSESLGRLQSNPTTSSVDKKLPVNESLSNSIIKDTYDQDSVMNITQHYLMFQEFEKDLFSKPESSNVSPGKEKRESQTSTGSKKCSNASVKVSFLIFRRQFLKTFCLRIVYFECRI